MSSPTRVCVKCPHCSYAGGSDIHHTLMTTSRKGIGFRCAGCGKNFSIEIRRPHQKVKKGLTPEQKFDALDPCDQKFLLAQRPKDPRADRLFLLKSLQSVVHYKVGSPPVNLHNVIARVARRYVQAHDAVLQSMGIKHESR
jgi:hypothetical protein